MSFRDIDSSVTNANSTCFHCRLPRVDVEGKDWGDVRPCDNCGLNVCPGCYKVFHRRRRVIGSKYYKCKPVADPTLVLAEGA